MKMEPKIARRIAKNVLLSLFIYALPVAAMLLALYVNGQRPWKRKTEANAAPTSVQRIKNNY